MTICAWCRGVIHPDVPIGKISHGLCLPCRDVLREEYGLPRPPNEDSTHA